MEEKNVGNGICPSQSQCKYPNPGPPLLVPGPEKYDVITRSEDAIALRMELTPVARLTTSSTPTYPRQRHQVGDRNVARSTLRDPVSRIWCRCLSRGEIEGRCFSTTRSTCRGSTRDGSASSTLFVTLIVDLNAKRWTVTTFDPWHEEKFRPTWSRYTQTVSSTCGAPLQL
jgi:hypothetical protein